MNRTNGNGELKRRIIIRHVGIELLIDEAYWETEETQGKVLLVLLKQFTVYRVQLVVDRVS